MLLMLTPFVLTGCKGNEANSNTITNPEIPTVEPTEDSKLFDYNIKEFTYTKYVPQIPGSSGMGYDENVKNAINSLIFDLEANKVPFHSEIRPNQVVLAMPGEGYLIHNNRSDNSVHMNVLRKKDMSFKEKNENGKQTNIYYNGGLANPFTTIKQIINDNKYNGKAVDIKYSVVGEEHKITIMQDNNLIFILKLYESRFYTEIYLSERMIDLNGFFEIELERVNKFIDEFNSVKGFRLASEAEHF